MSPKVEPRPHGSSVGIALRVIDTAWTQMRQRSRWAEVAGESPVALMHVSQSAAHDRAERARELVTSIDALELDDLPHDLRITIEVAAWHARRWRLEAAWYPTVFDCGGWYAPFTASVYGGVPVLNEAIVSQGRFVFAEASDCDRYLATVADYARLITQMRDRTVEQALRGMHMPRSLLELSVPLLIGLKARAVAALAVDPSRLEGIGTATFARELERRLHDDVAPAFDAFIDALGPDYASRCGDEVGMAQFPDGKEIYAELVRQHTTSDLTPHEFHELGLARMAQIHEAIDAAIAHDGFDGDARAYYAQIGTLPQWRAETAEGVSAIFQRFIDRLAPRIGEYFASVPAAPYGVGPLPAALEGAMTFGYYEAPTSAKPAGTYLFNTRNLTARPLVDLGTLTYHELVPGHHLHIAGEFENRALHPLRVHSYFNAFNEGWAEYAATFAGEIGMYETAPERFGRLMMDAFLTSRLVVDTGMNALGWTLERARAYMREHTFISDAEIASESIRYSCDIPGQSLAYKSGELTIMRLRDRMRAALGERFDVRAFHAAVVGSGSLPFDLVEAEVERAIRVAKGT
jgi:uncharacterized protein (DUF885 family)